MKTRECLENIDNYLRTKRGRRGSPLAYVVRDHEALPEANPDPLVQDPGYGLPTFQEELIRRTRLTGPDYQQDNDAVWQVLYHVTHDGPGWDWISSFSSSRNGRGAYQALRLHYLGDAYQGRVKASADKVIQSTFYDGQKHNFTFEMYASRLAKAFSDLADAGEPVLAERKVRILLLGIRDPRLETARGQIMVSPTMSADYDASVNFIAQYSDAVAAVSQNKRRVASMNGGGRGPQAGRGAGRGRGGRGRGGQHGGRGRGGRGNRTNNSTDVRGLTAGYMSPAQWQALSPFQRQHVLNLRSQSGQANQRQQASVTAVQINDDASAVTGPSTASSVPQGVGGSMSQRSRSGT